jgi:hypothetical protein
MRSLLAGIGAADIRSHPFPHVSVSDVLDADTYAALSASFPPASCIAWDGAPLPSNRRFPMAASRMLLNGDVSAAWKEFVTLHSSPAFFAEVVALFRDHWPAALRQSLGGTLLGHPLGLLGRDGYDSGARILLDARIEINTPVIERACSVRGVHLDTPNRLFSGLFYLRHPQDDALGGDLQLFRWKYGPLGEVDRFELPHAAVELVTTIAYRANQLVIFPHCIDALHGVSVREPTPHARRYVFLTAEIEEAWLAAPSISAVSGAA